MIQPYTEVDHKAMLEQLFKLLIHYTDDPDVPREVIPRLAIENMVVNVLAEQPEDFDGRPMLRVLREWVCEGGYSEKLTQSLLDNELFVEPSDDLE
jgi:hypothetical protein